MRLMALYHRLSRVYRNLHHHTRFSVSVFHHFPNSKTSVDQPPDFSFSGNFTIAKPPNSAYRNFNNYYDGNFLARAQALHFSTLANSKPDQDNNNGKRNEGVLTWIDFYLPKKVQPYARLARLDKPIGTWLLAWPCFWSITLAAETGSLPDVKMLALFGSGALLLRGAGCTINDLLDRDIDTKVERTRSRPVASGSLTPFQGLCFLGFQLLLGLGILLQLNTFSQVLGASSLFLVFSYPLMKRVTFWPQAYLGLTFNWGALLGWAAVRGSLSPSIVLPLYVSGVFWTLVYDTIYAHQDKEDDLKVGVKSTALRFGNLTKEWISGFGVACISSLALSGYNADIGWPYYAFLAGACGHLAWQIGTVNLSSRTDCNRKFVSNKWFGALVFCGILFGQLFSQWYTTSEYSFFRINRTQMSHEKRFATVNGISGLLFDWHFNSADEQEVKRNK